MKKLLLALLATVLLTAAGIGVLQYIPTPEDYKKTQRALSDVVPSNSIITQEMLDSAWAEALRVGGGNPEWKVPLTLAHAVVPMRGRKP